MNDDCKETGWDWTYVKSACYAFAFLGLVLWIANRVGRIAI